MLLFSSEIATRTAYTHYTGFEMGLTMLINPMLEPIHHSYINSMGIEVKIKLVVNINYFCTQKTKYVLNRQNHALFLMINDLLFVSR